MNIVTNIACKTIGTVGIGVALYNASRVGGQFSRNLSHLEEQKYLEKAYFNTRTLDSINYTNGSIQNKAFNLKTRNPIPSFWGKIKGGIRGFIYGLGDNLPLILFGSLAIACKNTFAKIGAVGIGITALYNVLKECFSFGKNNPVN
jgi:hypothetical protein